MLDSKNVRILDIFSGDLEMISESPNISSGLLNPQEDEKKQGKDQRNAYLKGIVKANSSLKQTSREFIPKRSPKKYTKT